jgi:hypothetical protein
MTRATHPADPWHYPRPELAAKYLQVFDVGLSSARALFAKRRMGKSEFLEQDLIPAARDAGYLTVYLNLWDARSQPAPAFLAMRYRCQVALYHRNATPILAAKELRFLSMVHSNVSGVSRVDASNDMSTAPQPRSCSCSCSMSASVSSIVDMTDCRNLRRSPSVCSRGAGGVPHASSRTINGWHST